MNYVVSGADRTTGRELTLNFQASSQSEAEAFANLSMLVSEVREQRPEAEPVEYATAATRRRASEVNWAAGIVFHARLLRIFSILLALMSILPLGEYGWIVLLRLWAVFVDRTAQSVLLLVESAAISPTLGIGIVLIAMAVFMRLTSYVALAISEMASKS